MTIDELKKLSNDKVLFNSSEVSLVIRSKACRYADFFCIKAIESIERESENIIRVTIPSGSAMGDNEVVVDLSTGIISAYGKIFDKPMPEEIGNASPNKPEPRKSIAKRFTPTINGFSIKDVHTMPSEDGYACYCKVYFNGKKVGDFVDKGDGGEYSFYADSPYSRSKIEEVIRSFPPTNRDYGFGPMEVPYDMNQMVNDLMEMKEIAKELRKLEGSGKDYVIIDEWRTGRQFTCMPPSGTSDADLKKKLDKDLMMHGISVYDMRRYRSLGDLHVVNLFVCEEMLSS
jgi:hypothetical protein